MIAPIGIVIARIGIVIARIGIVIAPIGIVITRRPARRRAAEPLTERRTPSVVRAAECAKGARSTLNHRPFRVGGEMATQRLTMKNIREILRQKWALQRSHRDVAASLDVSAGVVGKVVGKASEAGLTWDAVQALSDEALERVVYDGEPTSRARPQPDFTHIHAQRRRRGVTLALRKCSIYRVVTASAPRRYQAPRRFHVEER